MAKLNINLKRRTLVRIVSYGMAVVFILGGVAFAGWRQAYIFRRHIEMGQQRAFTDLVTNVTNIDTTLQKGIYANTPSMMSALTAQIYQEASSAQATLAQLPYAFIELENTAKFLSQAGDYAHSLSKNAITGTGFSDEARENLTLLSRSAQQIAQQLSELQAEVNEKTLRIGDIQQAQQQLSSEQQSHYTENVGYSIQQLEAEFPEFPTLIYDGPFSAHIDKLEALYLKGKAEVSIEQAQKNAAAFIGAKAELLKYQNTNEGKVRAYTFVGAYDGAEVTVDVTCAGGVVLDVLSSRTVSAAKIKPEDCVEKARSFLEGAGYKNMKESYWMTEGNIVLVNFSYVQDGVQCYPDLIKVSIAQDTGKMVGFEARGYIMSHTQRDIKTPAVTRQQAQGKVSPQLTVIAYQPAIIPSEGKNDVLCHEFKCTAPDKKKYFIYINAQTGLEQQILMILEDENGTLTM